MATKTFEELKQLAIQIRDEKTNKQNTANRVGSAMLEHINKLEQNYYDKTTTNEELKKRDDKLTELQNGVGLYNVDKNVPLGSGYYTSTTARAAVPSDVRKVGLIITYKTDATTSVTEQFIGSDVSGWATDTNWKNVGSEGGNKILEWETDAATTRKKVSAKERKAGMQISYKPTDSDWVNEQYIGTSFTDTEWVKDSNWEKIPKQKQLTELSDNVENNISFFQKQSDLVFFNEGKSQISKEIFTIVGKVYEVSENKVVLSDNGNVNSALPIKVKRGWKFYTTKTNSVSHRFYLVDNEYNLISDSPYKITQDGYLLLSLWNGYDTEDYIFSDDNFRLRQEVKLSNMDNLLTKKGYYGKDGNLVQSSGTLVCSELTQVKEGDEFFIDAQITSWYLITTFDENGDFISSGKGSLKYANKKYTVESGVGYIGFSSDISGYSYEYPIICKITDENRDYIETLIPKEIVRTEEFLSISENWIVGYNMGKNVIDTLQINRDDDISFPFDCNVGETTISGSNSFSVKNKYHVFDKKKILALFDIELLSYDVNLENDIISNSDFSIRVGERRWVYLYKNFTDQDNSSQVSFNLGYKAQHFVVHGIKVFNFSKLSFDFERRFQTTIGDSISFMGTSYAHKLNEFFGSVYNDLARSGYTLQQLSTDEWLEQLADNITFATISGGTNDKSIIQVDDSLDFFEDVMNNIDARTKKDSEDITPQICCINRMIDAIYTKNKYAKIILITPYTSSSEERNKRIFQISYIMKAIGTFRGIQVIDSSQILPVNINSYPMYASDGTHCNQECHVIWFYNILTRLSLNRLYYL